MASKAYCYTGKKIHGRARVISALSTTAFMVTVLLPANLRAQVQSTTASTYNSNSSEDN
jgi:hypothetical protein